MILLVNNLSKPHTELTGPAFESNQYFVDEGAGAVQVCMHLGGEGLVDNVTLFTLDGSARGKFNLVTLF